METEETVRRGGHQGHLCRAAQRAGVDLSEGAFPSGLDAGLSIPEGRARWDYYDKLLGSIRYMR